uniref:Uncharacterized protein n=1 Tax=Panagrolaimus superbus TaxID=310955 RepID=A0A914YVZ1_9BILA
MQKNTFSKVVNKSLIIMSIFESSDNSNSSSNCDDGECFSIEELRTKLKLDEESVNWLKNTGLPEEDPLLIVEIHCQRCFTDKMLIFAALVANGAQKIGPNSFQFNTWNDIYRTKNILWGQYRWAFYNSDPLTAQQLHISSEPTITTTAITSYTEGKNKLVVNPYQFFER